MGENIVNPEDAGSGVKDVKGVRKLTRRPIARPILMYATLPCLFKNNDISENGFTAC